MNKLKNEIQEINKETKLVLPFSAINRHSLALAGGKAANLGEMTQSQFPVPPGFCVTTAAYKLVAEGSQLVSVIAELDKLKTTNNNLEELAQYAQAARQALLAAPVPTEISQAISQSYQKLGAGAVAVRSSATAEDLPFASFAGQQDTYLNIVGLEAVLDAVKRCWASLWTDRAISYRITNRIDNNSVQLAVVVQKMVQAEIAGVLFTANPITGRRNQAVIDASPGLGEAVVSGAVNPDHFIVDTLSGKVLERSLGDKRFRIVARADGGTQHIETSDEAAGQACITDEQLATLSKLGATVEKHYANAPQDIEWAFDKTGKCWLTQTRPVTTLYPLPPGVENTAETQAYFSFNVAQGVFQPLTPAGIANFRLIGSALATFLGFPPADKLNGPAFLGDSSLRLFFNITTPLRSSFGRALLNRALGQMEARTAAVVHELENDSRFSLKPVARHKIVFRLLKLLFKRYQVPVQVVKALLNPAKAVDKVKALETELRKVSQLPAGASAADRLQRVEESLYTYPPRILPGVLPVVIAGLGSYLVVHKLLKDFATTDEYRTILKSLPNNPTTEMDLALWQLAEELRPNDQLVSYMENTPLEIMTAAYQTGELPGLLQKKLTAFLQVYGHRGVAEIDLGVARWGEDPTHILGILVNYLQLKNSELAPARQFQQGALEAEKMLEELALRAKRLDPVRAHIVKLALPRARALAGIRELPKYYIVLLSAQARILLKEVEAELIAAGNLATAGDIFFLTFREMREALAGKDFQAIVTERKNLYNQEMLRRHIPRVLLSDGTEPETMLKGNDATGKSLNGTPASAGIITAKARVILNPVGARLEPGEILVAPSTDPGWTPLFLTAGGLVMEMGGAMSHGAVVAREYGIPAVVGVAGATERITTGQTLIIDASKGSITIVE